MTPDDLLSTTRRLLRDGVQGRIHDDNDILLYLNDGQQKLALLTHSFVSADRPLGLTTGEDLYALDDDIVQVYSCTLEGYYGRLLRSTEVWVPDATALATPRRYTSDKATQSLRFYPVPDQDYTALLRVARLPQSMTLDDPDQECEVRSHWQLALCDWAAYRCFSTDDADGRNDNAAKLAKARFDTAINTIKGVNYQAARGPSARARGNRIK